MWSQPQTDADGVRAEIHRLVQPAVMGPGHGAPSPAAVCPAVLSFPRDRTAPSVDCVVAPGDEAGGHYPDRAVGYSRTVSREIPKLPGFIFVSGKDCPSWA